MGTSKIPSCPLTLNGSTGRMSSKTQAQASSKQEHRAAFSSAIFIGRQSISFAMHRAFPNGRYGIFGSLVDTIRMSPRYSVNQFLVSIVLEPWAIIDAQGCRTDNAFTMSPFKKVSAFLRLAFLSQRSTNRCHHKSSLNITQPLLFHAFRCRCIVTPGQITVLLNNTNRCIAIAPRCYAASKPLRIAVDHYRSTQRRCFANQIPTLPLLFLSRRIIAHACHFPALPMRCSSSRCQGGS